MVFSASCTLAGLTVHVTGGVTRVLRFGTLTLTLQFVKRFCKAPVNVCVRRLKTTAPGSAGLPSTSTRTFTPAVDELLPVPGIAVVVTSAELRETSINSVLGAVRIWVLRIVVQEPFAGAIVNFVICTAAFEAGSVFCPSATCAKKNAADVNKPSGFIVVVSSAQRSSPVKRRAFSGRAMHVSYPRVLPRARGASEK